MMIYTINLVNKLLLFVRIISIVLVSNRNGFKEVISIIIINNNTCYEKSLTKCDRLSHPSE